MDYLVGAGYSPPISAPPALLGRWRLVRTDPPLDLSPDFTLEFEANGRLIWRVRERLLEDEPGDRALVPIVCEFTYRTDGDAIRAGLDMTFHVAGDALTMVCDDATVEFERDTG